MTLNVEDFDPDELVIIAVGPNGVGKSTLLNILGKGNATDPNGFQPGSGIDSVTQDMVVKRFGIDGTRYTSMLLVDTPGLGDRDGKDTQNIAKMAQKLRELNRMHLFMLVFKGQDQRIDTHTSDVIDVLAACFGKDFLSNAALVFTHWPRDERSLARLANQGRSEREHAAAFNAYFQEALKMEGLELPYFFLDGVDFVEDPDLYMSQIKDIKDLAKRLEPYDCRDAKKVMMERDRALADLEEAKTQRDQEAEAARLAEQQREDANRRADSEAERAREEAAAARVAEQQREDANCRAETEAERAREEAAAARLAEQQREEANRRAEEEAERARQEAAAARLAEQQREDANRRAEVEAERARQEATAAHLARQEREEANRRAEEEAERARQEAAAALLAEQQREEANRRAEVEAKRAREEAAAARLAEQKMEEAIQRARLGKVALAALLTYLELTRSLPLAQGRRKNSRK